jgi:hypothetical protein
VTQQNGTILHSEGKICVNCVPSAEKITAPVFWDEKDVILVNSLSRGQVNYNHYTETFPKSECSPSSSSSYNKNVKRHCYCMSMPYHTRIDTTLRTSQNLDGRLSSSDFHLFGPLKDCM